jgi:hypothetical protein
MRFMVIVKASPEFESGRLPDPGEIGAMGLFNEELVKAGVMLAGEGLHPSSKGARLRFDGTQRTVIDGPFTEAKELVGGFWILQASSKAEVIEWMKRSPFRDGEVEIRQIMEAEDFTNLPPEMIEANTRLRAEIERNKK